VALDFAEDRSSIRERNSANSSALKLAICRRIEPMFSEILIVSAKLPMNSVPKKYTPFWLRR